MTTPGYRVEHDSMGPLEVSASALWGAQTQRALENFPASGLRLPRAIIRALGLIKRAAAAANAELGDLPADVAAAIASAALEVAEGHHDEHFPIDVFQTGSGTSSNMNANEVIATLASRRLGRAVQPNDQVNMSQSSNDVMPTAIHVAAVLLLEERLLPALEHLAATIGRRAHELEQVVTTGRTHLMDAMPITLGQELSGWGAQIEADGARLRAVMPRLLELAQGGTAVGTGVNARPEFAAAFARELGQATRLDFRPSRNYFAALSSQDTAVELSGQLKVLAVSLMKIANDLRWMNSGPLSGLGEIALPALQPGSSIMPGKVNPVVPEAVTMIAAQVIGNDAAITIAGQSGNFQLNVMLPLIAYDLVQSLELLAIGARNLADRAIAGFTVSEARLRAALDRNPVLVTGLNRRIGYEAGAKIAKRAYAEDRPVIDVAVEMTSIPRGELERLLDPHALTGGGMEGSEGGPRSAMIEGLYSREHIRASLEPRPSGAEDDMLWLAGSREAQERMRASVPQRPLLPAAVLVPLVEREAGWTVLLTQRAATLKAHAGQISFPGGRIEPTDRDPWHAALREAREEIGLSESYVEFAGYLPDHWLGTGFRVTPVVGFVNPIFELRIATEEVHDVFEVPLQFILDEANHRPRTRRVGEVTVEIYDIPWGDRLIWGATAGMLLTLRRRLQGAR